MKSSQFFIYVIILFFGFVEAQTNDNAAVGYWKTFSEMQDFPKNITSEKIDEIIKKGMKLDKTILEQLRLNRYSIKQAVKISALEKSSFILDIEWDEGAEILLPHLSKAVSLGKNLVLDGMRCVEEGKWEDAAERYIAALRLGYLVQQDNIIISSLVMQRIVRLSLDAVLNMSADGKVPLHSLEKIKGAMDKISSMNMEKAISSERYLLIPYKKRLQLPDQSISVLVDIRNLTDSAEIAEKELNEVKNLLKKDFSDITPQEREKICKKLGMPISAFESQQVLGSYLQKGMDDYSAYSEKLVQCFKQPYKIGIENIKKMEAEVSSAHMIVKIASPEIFTLYNKYHAFMAYFKMTGMVLSLKIYSREKGNLPQSIKELSGERYKDPFTGEDFQYQAKDGKAWIQSAGPEPLKIEIR